MNRSILLLVLPLLVACGGAPFEARLSETSSPPVPSPEHDAGSDAAPVPEGNSTTSCAALDAYVAHWYSKCVEENQATFDAGLSTTCPACNDGGACTPEEVNAICCTVSPVAFCKQINPECDCGWL